MFYSIFVHTLQLIFYDKLMQKAMKSPKNPMHPTNIHIAKMSLFCLHYTDVKICFYANFWSKCKFSRNCHNNALDISCFSTLCVHSSLSEQNFTGYLGSFSATLGSLEFGLHYDQESNSLHCSILKAKVTALFDKGTFIQSYSLFSWLTVLYWWLYSGHGNVMILCCFYTGSKAHGFKRTGRSLCQTPSAARGP